MTSNFKLLQAHFDDLHETQERSRAIALNGALKAFEKPHADAPRGAPLPVQSPGAFSAATSAAGRFTPSIAVERLPHLSDGSNSAASHAFARHQHSLEQRSASRSASPYKTHQASRRSSANSLAPSVDGTVRAKSPSNIAAVIAAQRFAPREPAASPQATVPKSWHIDAQLLNQPRHASPQPLDEEEQQPPPGAVRGVTTWLESIDHDVPAREAVREPARMPSPVIANSRIRPKVVAAKTSSSLARPYPVEEEIVRVAAPPTEIRSPKPMRVPSASKKLRDATFESNTYQDNASALASQPPAVPTKPESVRRISTTQQLQSQSSSRSLGAAHISVEKTSEPDYDLGDGEHRDPRMPSWKPTPPPPRRSGTIHTTRSPVGLGMTQNTLDAAFAHPASRQPRRAASGDTLRTTPDEVRLQMHSHGSLAASEAASHISAPSRRISPHMTGDSLANAIVASSLASSRAPSPTKVRPDRPHLPRRSTDRPRTPFSHFKQQHTGESRTSSPVNVVNVIVRDIWARSRLPAYVLEEVWELVDRSHTGRLDREEFVVGLWLIDQRLMGKKLPVKARNALLDADGGGVNAALALELKTDVLAADVEAAVRQLEHLNLDPAVAAHVGDGLCDLLDAGEETGEVGGAGWVEGAGGGGASEVDEGLRGVGQVEEDVCGEGGACGGGGVG
ncbi:hypothetical protein FH972_024298 [Carpinus fangiana]|uniref:EH domain-containing protein n=1 Tax=Carpinus fangiana TaxID=176857 RepID=A0A5N6KXN1_9ROSI|nr:hypothetical protein FH972_024298 [Carpinus fangiana]